MGQMVRPRNVVAFEDTEGNIPFEKWLSSLKDPQTRRRILRRVYRLESGNFGDFKSLKDGVLELRLAFGSGYRVYFAEDGDTLILLLCGGDKSTQSSDIEAAKSYWKEYKNNA